MSLKMVCDKCGEVIGEASEESPYDLKIVRGGRTVVSYDDLCDSCWLAMGFEKPEVHEKEDEDLVDEEDL